MTSRLPLSRTAPSLSPPASRSRGPLPHSQCHPTFRNRHFRQGMQAEQRGGLFRTPLLGLRARGCIPDPPMPRVHSSRAVAFQAPSRGIHVFPSYGIRLGVCRSWARGRAAFGPEPGDDKRRGKDSQIWQQGPPVYKLARAGLEGAGRSPEPSALASVARAAAAYGEGKLHRWLGTCCETSPTHSPQF